jgi:hypothetical protein
MRSGSSRPQEPLYDPPQSGPSHATRLERLGHRRLVQQALLFQRALPELT